jgi:serine/threonine protein kinase
VENTKIGSYTLVRLLGSGGMGRVYEAVNDQIQRRAAIKVLHKRYNNNRQIAQRFINEARAVNIVQHPSLVNIYEFGQAADGSAYIVMEYLDGETLRQRLERSGGRLPQDVAVRLCRQIASALSAAHQKGIIHRDLKPVNIMVVADPEAAGGERAKVLDFGLAKVALPESEADGSALTHTGTILGTPAYMAPEQCRSARSVDDRSDVYALGIILYEMLSSDIPFDAETDAELLSMHMYKDPPPLREKAPNVAPELGELVHRMLAKQQGDRPSAAEVASELAKFSSSSVPPPAAVTGEHKGRAGRSDQETLVEPPTYIQPGGSGAKARLAAAAANQPAPKAASSSKGRIVLLGLLLVVLAATLGGILGWLRGREQGGKPPVPGQTPSPPTSATVHWSLSSIPSGAEVVDTEHHSLGRTPLMLENPRSVGTASIFIRAAGYAEAQISLPLDRDEVLGVTLTRLSSSPQQDRAPAGTSAVDGGPSKGVSDAGEEPEPPPAGAPTGKTDDSSKRVQIVD